MKTEYQSKLPATKTAGELLDMYYLDVRSALLECAAFFDRLDRAQDCDSIAGDQRLVRIREMCRIVEGVEPRRTEQILELLSEDAS